MDEVIKLAKLLMVIPATNASSERAFSTLRYIKNYLRTTKFQERLNNLIVYVYKERLDHLDLTSIAKDFVKAECHCLVFFTNYRIDVFYTKKTPTRYSE